MKTNYQLILDEIISGIHPEEKKPTLLLHSCCGPCSSYVLEYLSRYFDITVFFYNPNIYPEKEYYRRAETQKQLIASAEYCEDVKLVVCDYRDKEFYDAVRGLEAEPEGGARCTECFWLRLRAACKYAKDNGFDYFCSTLTVSPHKNAQLLNAIGKELEQEQNVLFLPSDFKKREGYKRSIELSHKYGLYRQDYCGCIYSLRSENMAIK